MKKIATTCMMIILLIATNALALGGKGLQGVSTTRDLSDVSSTLPANGEVLIYNSSTGLYEPGEGGGGGGSGDVTGPASSTSGNIATFSGTTGKIIQDSGKTLTQLGYQCFTLYPTTVGGDIVTGTKAATQVVRAAFTVSAVYANVNTAGSGSVITIDINELVVASQPGAGTSILSTKLTIDAGEADSTTAASAAVISDTAIAAHSQLIVDIDGADSSNTGAGLEVDVCGSYN